jgi:CRISPR system Cascade subunit CasB
MTPHEQAREAARWWRDLQPNSARKYQGDRAALARLRRTPTPLAAAEEPATINLARRLHATEQTLSRAALCAAVLACVRDDDPWPAARRLGLGDGGRPLISPLRFQRLIQAESDEERLVQFRRAIALADHKLNVRDLAEALLDWSEKRRIAWIFRYHDSPPPGAARSIEEPQIETEGAAP